VSVTLSSSLPNDDRNGLGAISSALVDSPGAMQLVVAIVNCRKVTIDMDSGDNVPTARILAVEGFEAHTAAGKQLHKILRQQYAQRTGRDELPFPPEVQQE
jgi:hypothetical protein